MARHVPTLGAVILLLVCTSALAFAETDFPDADYLASALSDSLLAPDSLVARIDHDLQLIRQHTPAVADIHHSCQRLRLGAVAMTFTYGAQILFLAGQHEGLNELHARIGSPQVSWLAGYSCIFYYAQPYKPVPLEALHLGLVGVSDVHAIPMCIGDGPDVQLSLDGTYRFRSAWGDGCTVGSCDFTHVWIFSVDGEVVTLLQDYGDPVPSERISWGTVKALFR